MNHYEQSAWDIYNLGRYAQYAEKGWFFIELVAGSGGNRSFGMVHEDVPCAHRDCPLARVRGHRHISTPEQRQEMQKYVTRWLTHLFQQEQEAAMKQADVDELWRMWQLSPPPFYCNFELQRQDEARERAAKDIDQLNRMWRLPDIRGRCDPHSIAILRKDRSGRRSECA